jgi:hypothetical protein
MNEELGAIAMRIIYAAIALPCLVGSSAAQPQAQAAEVDLPYSACGDMTVLEPI